MKVMNQALKHFVFFKYLSLAALWSSFKACTHMFVRNHHHFLQLVEKAEQMFSWKINCSQCCDRVSWTLNPDSSIYCSSILCSSPDLSTLFESGLFFQMYSQGNRPRIILSQCVEIWGLSSDFSIRLQWMRESKSKTTDLKSQDLKIRSRVDVRVLDSSTSSLIVTRYIFWHFTISEMIPEVFLHYITTGHLKDILLLKAATFSFFFLFSLGQLGFLWVRWLNHFKDKHKIHSWCLLFGHILIFSFLSKNPPEFGVFSTFPVSTHASANRVTATQLELAN